MRETRIDRHRFSRIFYSESNAESPSTTPGNREVRKRVLRKRLRLPGRLRFRSAACCYRCLGDAHLSRMAFPCYLKLATASRPAARLEPGLMCGLGSPIITRMACRLSVRISSAFDRPRMARSPTPIMNQLAGAPNWNTLQGSA